MKKLFACLLSATLMTNSFIYVHADNGKVVRVGLEKNYLNETVVNGGDSSIRVGIGDERKYQVDFDNTYQVKPITNKYYLIGEYKSSYLEVVQMLDSYIGYQVIPVLTENGWTLYVRTDSGKSMNKPIVNTGANCVGFMVDGKFKFLVDGKVASRVGTKSDIIKIGNSEYREEIEFNRQGNVVKPVNVLNMESYLYGVINSEMPSSWPIEAQKAQAIAARTYASRVHNKHSDYDLCDTVHCQAYLGFKNETDAGRSAVELTSGEKAYFNNELIDCVYFSSSGGATFNSEDVWLGETPYLKGFKDNNEVESLTWTRSFTYSDLTRLTSALGTNIGEVYSVVPTYNKDGLVLNLSFIGRNGKATITKEQVRTFFSSTPEGSLKSRNFVVVNSTSNGIVLNGKGYGHGVGMSQYGAKNMAQTGHKYTDILSYYYKNIEVK